MNKILTSLVENTHIDYDALEQKFTVISLAYKGWSKTEQEQRLPTLAKRIYQSAAVFSLLRHSKEQKYWVLLPKGSVLKLEDDTLAIQSVSLEHLPSWVLSSLLIRATPRLLPEHKTDSKRLEADGLYYVVERLPLSDGRSMFITVNIDSMMCVGTKTSRLVVKTVTFTPLDSHRTREGNLPNKIAKAPRYRIDQLGQNLIRDGGGDYIKKSIWKKKKNRVAAFKLGGQFTLEAYYLTRLGVISLFFDDLHRAYGEHFSIQLQSIEPTERKRVNKKTIDQSYNHIFEILRQQPIWITNQSDDAEATARLISLLPSDFHHESANNIQPNGLNILLVNNKEQYEEQPDQPAQPDPYKIARMAFPESVIQSCYPENLKKNSRPVVETLLKELLIKTEVRQRRLLLDYPSLPADALFITSVKPSDTSENKKESKTEPWPMFYCRVDNRQLEPGSLSEKMQQQIKEHLNASLNRAVFEGYERADLIFWPSTGDALIMTDTEALTLPNEPEIHEIMKQLNQAAMTGVPAQKVADYIKNNPSAAIIPKLHSLLNQHAGSIPVTAFKPIHYKGKEAVHFYDYLTEQGYRIKTSMQAKDTGVLSATTGIWIHHPRALYSAGSTDSAQRDQDNFNHIYCVQTNGIAVPDWFWSSLDVWHVKHRGFSVYPYIFKHLREYAQLNQQR